MDKILEQAPRHLTDEEIIKIYEENNKDMIQTLIKLWELEEEIPKNKTKWDEIRETCDLYDNEMNKIMKKE